MDCLILQYLATVGEQLYAECAFFDAGGNILSTASIGLGTFAISSLNDIATAAQTAINAYAVTNSLGTITYINLPSAAVGIT